MNINLENLDREHEVILLSNADKSLEIQIKVGKEDVVIVARSGTISVNSDHAYPAVEVRK